MAVVKFNNKKSSVATNSRGQLKRVIEYIIDPRKTDDDLINGIGVNKDNALERMQTVKDFYLKQGGREYIHFCVSFKGEIDPVLANNAAKKIAELFEGYQVLHSVHLNTQNTHAHFVVNSVSVENGKKFSQSKRDLRNLKKRIEAICFGMDCVFEEFEEIETEYFSTDEELFEPMIFYDKPQCIDYGKLFEN